MELIPRKNWMKDMTSNKQYTEIREKLQQIYKLNIHDLMQEFSQSHGVHTYQRMYGCEWDDQTGDSQGFDQYGYDGRDFITLDLKERRYTNSVKEAMTTVMKWNNDRTQLDFLKHYFRQDCVDWLKEFLNLSKATLEKADPPKVSLLQKKEGNYTCHVTGFLFRNTTILWRKNGQAMSDSKSEDTLPNEDRTFQRRLNLYAPADECEESQYTCVVEHKSLTEPIQKTLTVNKSSSSKCGSDALYIFMHPVFLVIITVIAVLIVLRVLWKHRKKIKDQFMMGFFICLHRLNKSLGQL
ncbi:hypothetical protein ABG768_001552 [Culter alburnus]|uniref:Ig-like domain-containing protein n=1 Tax=Culter alburnus TaxID=194366 RepID=A0AAW2A0Y8_CULAL